MCVREREREGSGTIEPTLVALGPRAALDLAALRMLSQFDPWHPVFTFLRAQSGESLYFLFVLGRIRPAHSYQRS